MEWYWEGNTKVLEQKPVPVPTCQTTNPTWTRLEMNLDLRVQMPATASPIHGVRAVFVSNE